MTDWNSEEDGYITDEKDTWTTQPKQDAEFKVVPTVEFDFGKEVSGEYLDGVVDTLEMCAKLVSDTVVSQALRDTAEKVKNRQR